MQRKVFSCKGKFLTDDVKTLRISHYSYVISIELRPLSSGARISFVHDNVSCFKVTPKSRLLEILFKPTVFMWVFLSSCCFGNSFISFFWGSFMIMKICTFALRKRGLGWHKYAQGLLNAWKETITSVKGSFRKWNEFSKPETAWKRA